MVFLCPRFIKAFEYGCFIPKPVFILCLNSSCSPFIILLNICRVNLRHTSDLISHVVMAHSPSYSMLLKHSSLISVISIGYSSRRQSIFLPVCVCFPVSVNWHFLTLCFKSASQHTHKPKSGSILRSVHPSKVAVNSYCLKFCLCLYEIMNYRLSSLSSTGSSCINCLVLLH